MRSSACAVVRSPQALSPLAAKSRPQFAPIPNTSSSSSGPSITVAPKHVRTPDFGVTNRAGMVRRRPIRPMVDLLARRARWARFRARRVTRARITCQNGRPMRGGCARRSEPPNDRAERHLVTKSRTQRLTWDSPAPLGGAPRDGGQCADRCRVAGRVECPRRLAEGRRRSWLRPFQPFRSWVLLALADSAKGLKRST
jgi:hypothetical protein